MTQALARGVCFHGMWSGLYPTTQKRQAVLEKLAANGCELIRLDVGWGGIEQMQGGWDAWYGGLVDQNVNEAAKRGIKVLLLLWLTPAWANGGIGQNYGPTKASDYAAMARRLALRYGSKLAGIEVWNEPDEHQQFFLVSPGADRYKQLVALTRATRRALIGTGVPTAIGAPSSCDDEHYHRLYAMGLTGADFDIASVHGYPGKADEPPDHPDDGNRWWLSHLPAVIQVLKSHLNGKKPIWVTEYGWSTNLNRPGSPVWTLGVSEAKQAEYLRRTREYVSAKFPTVKALCWYNELDTGSDRYSNQNRFGLLREDLSAKPALAELSA